MTSEVPGYIDTAVLAFQVFTKTKLMDMEYNGIEVYQKETYKEWPVIHSTFSFIQQMDKKFGNGKSMLYT